MQCDWFMYHLRSDYKIVWSFPLSARTGPWFAKGGRGVNVKQVHLASVEGAKLMGGVYGIRYTMYGTRNVFTPQLSPFREIAAEAQDYLSDFNYFIIWVSPLTEY